MTRMLLLCFIITSAGAAQTLNRQMMMDSVWESTKLNVAFPEKALIIVRSQVQNLQFDEPNRNLKVEAVGSGDWYVYLTPGTARLKINAAGFQRLELPPINFKRKQTYEMKISALGYASSNRADDNLIDVTFQLSQSGVYASYGNLTPILSKSTLISFKVPKGEYTFHFQKAGYADEKRTISVSAPVQMPVELRAGAGTPPAMKLPGFVVMQSDPPGAEILVNGQRIGATPFQFDLPAGRYQLEVRKPLYHPDLSVFDVRENETKEITRKLRARYGYLTVSCTIAGATVYVDEKLLGTAPMDRRQVESGKHTLRIEAPLYHSMIGSVQIRDGEAERIDAVLKPAFGSLEIVSAPEDSADVYIDNIRVGTTPYTAARMASGKYVLRVAKEHFTEVEEEIAVVDGLAMKRTVILGRNYGELTVDAPGQTIRINGSVAGEGRVASRLAPGMYAVRAERGDAYEAEERNVVVAIGEPVSLTLNARPRLGTVSVVVEPFEARGADIFVDEVLIAKAPTSFPLIIGTHSIAARSGKYLEASQLVTVKEGEQNKVSFSLTTYEGSRQASIDAWGRSKWISAAVAVVAGAAAYYFQNRSDAAYDEYTSAVTTAGAQDARNRTTTHSTYAGVALGAAAAGGIGFAVSWIWQAAY